MRYTTCITLIVVTALICATMVALDYIRYSVEMEMRARPTPILQIIPMPGSDQSEPDRPDVWREEYHPPKSGV